LIIRKKLQGQERMEKVAFHRPYWMNVKRNQLALLECWNQVLTCSWSCT